MSSREFAEWQAYYRLEPFGPDRQDAGHAITSMVVAETNRDSKKRSQPYTVQDFLPIFSEEQAEQVSRDQLESKVRAAFGV